MCEVTLTNKPLIEAIFEFRWKLTERQDQPPYDPHYTTFPGMMFAELREEYPVHVALPAAQVPDEITPYVVKNQFRVQENGWPLVQIGPGVLTLNATSPYTWDDFRERAEFLMEAFYAVHPDAPGNLDTDMLSLRYLNSVEFDFANDDPFEFLRDMLHMHFELPAEIVADGNVEELPVGLDVRASFRVAEPLAVATLRARRGQVGGADSIIWETQVMSRGGDAPNTQTDVSDWCELAHDVIHRWFFATIAGDLRRRFE